MALSGERLLASMQLSATESEIAALENPRFGHRNRSKVKEKKNWKAGLWALLFLGPNLILFLVFTAYPVGYGVYLSLYNYSILKPKKWVGLENYRDFINDPKTPDLIWRTISGSSITPSVPRSGGSCNRADSICASETGVRPAAGVGQF